MSLEKGSSLEIVPTDAAPTLTIGTVTTLAAGAQATVANSGTEQNAVLDFGIPAGAQGIQGVQGDAGNDGNDGADATNPNFTIGTVSSLAPGSTPTVAVSGTYPNLVLDFGLTRGDTGSGSTVAWGDVTGTLSAQADLQAALDAKAASAHSHAVADTTGLQAALDGKAAAAHNHAIADSTGLQAALDAKAPLASPTFTGIPAAPTAASSNNSTQLATTAYVQNNLGSYAKLASPALTGSPTVEGDLIGFRNLPTSRTVASNITLADSDKGKKILISGTRTVTINPNATTAIDDDAIGTIVNTGTGTITVSRGTGVSAKLMGTGADANRSIAAGGVATWMKVGTNDFFIGGPGVS